MRRLGIPLLVLLSLPGAQSLARLFVATSEGPYVTHSWGEYWETLRHRLPLDIRTFYCIGPRAYAGGLEGLFVSDDFGESWSAVKSWKQGEVDVILTSLYFAADPVIFVGTRRGLYRSRDGGEDKWERIAEPFIQGEVHSIVWPGPALFVAAAEGLFRSNDTGDSWERAGKGLPDVAVLSLAHSSFFAMEPVIFAGLDGAGLYRSTDGGETFQPVGGSDAMQRTVRQLYWWKSVLFAGTDDGLFVSHDAGESWESASAELEGKKILAISIPAPDAPLGSDVLIGTEQGIYKTSDGARTWRQMNDGMKPAVIFGFGSFPSPPETFDNERNR
jgi:photosystem II stability/assembly factor-like uncharacterized protein